MDKKTPKKKKKKPAQDHYITLSRKTAFEWFVGFFLVCGFMFIIGVLVGRNTAPVRFDVDRIENQLAEIRASIVKKKKQIRESVQKCLPEIEQIDVIDTLKEKGKKPAIYKQYIPPVKTPKYGKTAPVENKSQTTPNGKTETASAQTPDNPPPASRSALAGKKAGFTIQVAALRDSAKAKMITERFRDKGYPAYCKASDIKGEKWFRVRMGPYPDRAAADKDCSRLREAGVKPVLFRLKP